MDMPTTEIPLRHPFHRLTHCLLALVVALASGPMFTSVAHAEASCGEPDRSKTIDEDDDGDRDEEMDFEKCVRRDFTYDGTDKTIVVYWSESDGRDSDQLTSVDTDGDGSDDLTTSQIGNMVAAWTEEAWTKYRDYGFDDPLGSDRMEVHIFDHPRFAGWCCGSTFYEFNTPSLIDNLKSDAKDAQAIAYHEMWHASEWSGGKGGWVNEGTASTMTDHVNIPVDNDDSNDYISRVWSYMGDPANGVTDRSYTAAPFWKYFMERAGTTDSEPDRGVDGMLAFWDNLDTDGMTTINAVLDDIGAGDTVRTLFTDFTVANYAKEITGAGVPGKYMYQDELQDGAPDYPAVPPDVNEFLNPGEAVIEQDSLGTWAAKYYKFRPDPAVEELNIEFLQDSTRQLGYSLLLIKDGDLVEEQREMARNFSRSIPNDDYDEVTVVVASFQSLANYRYSVNATEPEVDIVDPRTTRQAMAGDPAAPDKILVKVEVLSPDGGAPITGLNASNFTFTIGGTEVPPADIVATSYIQGQYWFLLRPPMQPGEGSETLDVDYADGLATDSEFNAVNYQVRTDADNVLVIDRSGSMADFGKLAAAQEAARLYVDSWRDNDQIGVVSYADEGRVDTDLQPYTTGRGPALTEIADLTALGLTAIGDGLSDALGEFLDAGVADHTWDIILLSDGLENPPSDSDDPTVNDFLDTWDSRDADDDQVPRVHTVALGADADRSLMQNIADKTGGSYQFASEPADTADTAGFATLAAVGGGTLGNELSEIYRVISETVAHHQQVYAAQGSKPALGAPADVHTIQVDGSAREAIFVFQLSPANAPSPDVTLLRPDGTPMGAPDRSTIGHQVWRVASPMPGEWQMRVENEEIIIQSVDSAAVANPDPTYLVEASLDSELTLEGFLGLAPEDRLAGRGMPILVSLAGTAPVTGASVAAEITGPGGAVHNLMLYDDGLHGDGAANDGFYGATFSRTSLPGSYVAVLSADGATPLGQPFARRLRLSFDMAAGTDADGDGIPDWWEELYGTQVGFPDADGDPDGDGLTTGEEFELGTHPLQSDSDGSGESDGSEADRGGDPTDPADDRVACPLEFSVVNYTADRQEYLNPKASVLHFSVDPAHERFAVWRATDPAGPWLLIDSFVPPTGYYLDHGVALGTTYHYRLQAFDAAGNGSCILGPRSTTPNAEAVPPVGEISIADGAATTSTLDVMLNLEYSVDATEVMIADTADFAGADWQPVAPEVPWTLVPRDNNAVVFAKYRDAGGNVSEMVADLIRLVPSCDQASPSSDSLWPPQHQLTGVDVLGISDPDGDPVTVGITGIMQDEPVNAPGDGNTCPDAQVSGDAAVMLRAERGGRGDGRVYHVQFSANDGRGASCTGTVRVCVPHDRNGGCIDQGPRYDATRCATPSP